MYDDFSNPASREMLNNALIQIFAKAVRNDKRDGKAIFDDMVTNGFHVELEEADVETLRQKLKHNHTLVEDPWIGDRS